MFNRKWDRRSQGTFLIRMGESLLQGYTLQDAIQLQSLHQKNIIQEKMTTMLRLLSEGETLTEVLTVMKFPNECCITLYFSEQSGELAHGFIESGQLMLKREEHRSKLRKLLRYPLFLIWMFIIMIFIISTFLIPNFMKLYHSLNLELPLVTRIVLSLNHNMVSIGIGILVITLCGSVCFIYFKKIPIIKKISVMSQIPLLSRYIKLYFTRAFAFHLGSLLRSGLSINQALDTMTKQHMTAFSYQEALHIRQAIIKGEKLDHILAERSYYLREFIEVIRHGQNNGRLGSTLMLYSDTLLRKLEEMTQTWLAIVQPATLVFIGILLLSLFSSILIPIFHIMNGL
ncbi:type II secretion system F family protein [Terrilactibacillus sp. BCM23-1]|uniref:Type II secretion system F family protein n=1 Tax=Terrilactibacillus tamarindi TaxID=2599694 RepID=A0A6N8CSM3_9BACI|nr:competence type IV pilus assembly protein ComGB [Terrilactibacillus tamarindi]MTT32658.1 type II secretion system F family protein [Terrilactibacillus tamarindi]